MTTAVQHRRGTTAEHSTFTGLEGEVTIDTTKDTAVIHDGSLAGGYPLAKETLANVNPSTLSAITGAATASDDLFLMYDTSALAMKKITRAELNNAMEADALANVSITGGTINGTTIGGTTAAAGSFTTLSASGNVTLSGGTANGVAYLNGSKVLTSGSALTFDGSTLNITGTATMDGLTVDGSVGSISMGSTGNILDFDRAGANYIRATDAAGLFQINAGGKASMRLDANGDISFYEDTGTTPKFFWDASAESLGIGTSSDASTRANATTGNGHVIQGSSYAVFTRESASSGQSVMVLNDTGVDGSILDLRKDGTTVGSIGTAGDDLIIGTGTNGIRFIDADPSVSPYNPSGLSLQNGVIDLGRSNARFKDLYLSGGVYLGGTAAANALDDYETGTWTPTVGGVYGNVPSSGWTFSYATYVKVGNFVHVKCKGVNTSTSSILVDDRFQIEDLPFTPKYVASVNAVGTAFVYGAISSGNNAMGNVAAATSGTTSWIYITHVDGAVDWSNNLTVSLVYEVA